MGYFFFLHSPPADGPNKTPQTLNQSMFQNITYCVISALLDTKEGGEEKCIKEIEGLVLTPQRHCHDNRKGRSRAGRKRAQLQWEARAQLRFLPHFMCAGCSCLLCPLWMKPLIAVSGAVSQKCVMRKRQDVNVLSRKNQFHGQMSWDRKANRFLSAEDLRAFSLLRITVNLNKDTEPTEFSELAWAQRTSWRLSI